MYEEIVETNTTLSAGDCTLIAADPAVRISVTGNPGPVPPPTPLTAQILGKLYAKQ
jgi:hypothetical protein